MSNLRGYSGESLKFLSSRGFAVGDRLRISSDLEYTGILMPRYEGGGDRIILKLASGYNVGIDTGGITSVERLPPEEAAVAPEEAPAVDSSLPRILLLSTGGTISSRIDYRTGAVTPTVTPEELNASVPELACIARIDTEILFSEYSENLQPEHWLAIARRLDELVNSEYSGIILAHGTDTMHYTSSFLSFALSGYPIPVAVVGSQRSSDRPSSDAALNLIGAARFLAGNPPKNPPKGIFVLMHYDGSDETVACHLGTRVRKMHTSRRDAFQTIGAAPAFLVSAGGTEGDAGRSFFTSDSYEPSISLDTRVALVKYHPGYDPKILDYLAESGVRAIILEGTGLGHVGRALYGGLERAARRGIFLGMTSQCIGGRVRMTVYESGRDLMKLGVVPLEDMIPEVALVKAMWVLGRPGDVKDGMLSRVASEFSD